MNTEQWLRQFLQKLTEQPRNPELAAWTAGILMAISNQWHELHWDEEP